MIVPSVSSPPSASRPDAISLRQLRFVAALADTSSFSRAADRMAVSQPALSAAIRQVETLLDVRLFDRTTHSVALTEAGRAMLPHALRLLTTADNAFADMRDAARRQRSIVRIGAIPSAVPVVAATLAAQGEIPGVSVHIRDAKSDDLIEDLRTGALDVAICAVTAPEEAFVATHLMDDEMLLAVPIGHPLAAAKRLSWRMLAGHEVVHFAGGSIGDLVSTAMRQNRLRPSGRYRVDQVDSLFGLVRAGLAVGVMPRLYTLGSALDGVILLSLTRPVIRRRLVLYHRAELATEYPLGATIAARFATALAERLRATVGGGGDSADPADVTALPPSSV